MTHNFDSSYFKGYHLMPAAVDSSFGNFESIGVKYESNPKSKWLTRDTKDGVHVYYYPDRTLYKSRPGSNHACVTDIALDAYLDYSTLTNPELYSNMGYRYAMISPHNMQFRKAPLRNPKLRLFADSGGFQIRQGITDFIDPESLVDFYNASTDIGVGLDVPMHPLLYSKYLERMSHVTSRNNKFIKAHLNNKVSLYDLNHGMNLKDRELFFNVTEQYAANDGIAMGGTSSKARGEYGVAAHLVNGVIGVAYVLARSKGRYRTAHVLGTTTPFYMFVFHLITKSGFFPHITSDSSTYAQASIMNTQLTSIPGQSTLYRNTLPKGDVLYRSPCSCPVCSMVGYSHHLVSNNRSNMVHNMYHYAYLNDLIADLADQWLAGSIPIAALGAIVSPSAFQPRHFHGVLKFLSDMFESNFNKAYRKNENFLAPMLGKHKQTSLFGVVKTATAPHEDAVRTDKILTVYENWQSERGV